VSADTHHYIAEAVADYCRTLREKRPEFGRLLRKGIAIQELRDLMDEDETELPSELIALLTFVNGQRLSKVGVLLVPQVPIGLDFAEARCVLSWRGSKRGTRDYCPPVPRSYAGSQGIKEGFWRDDWFPIGSETEPGEFEDMLIFVDLDPAPGGTKGQVVLERTIRTAGSEQITRTVLASSIAQFFRDLTANLQAMPDATPAPTKALRKAKRTVAAPKLKPDLLARFGDLLDQIRGCGVEADQSVGSMVSSSGFDLQDFPVGFPRDVGEVLRIARRRFWNMPKYDSVVLYDLDSAIRESVEPESEMEQILVTTSLSPRVKPFLYSKRRTTFAYSDYYVFQYDQDPTEDGVKGQIVVADTESGEINLFASDLNEFLQIGIQHLALEAAAS